jgi:GTP-binding protein HflX
VIEVLTELGVIDPEEGGSSAPIVEVWNKWDLLDQDQARELSAIAASDDRVIPLSAITGKGIDDLRERLGNLLTEGARVHEFILPASDGQRIAWLHAHGDVIAESDAGMAEDGPRRRLEVRLTQRELGRFVSL